MTQGAVSPFVPFAALAFLVPGCVDLSGLSIETSDRCLLANLSDNESVAKSYACFALEGEGSTAFSIADCRPGWQAGVAVAAAAEAGSLRTTVTASDGTLLFERTFAEPTGETDVRPLPLGPGYTMEITQSPDLFNGTVTGTIGCGADLSF